MYIPKFGKKDNTQRKKKIPDMQPGIFENISHIKDGKTSMFRVKMKNRIQINNDEDQFSKNFL